MYFIKFLFITAFIFTCAELFASETLDLSDVPWTDAAEFWTCDGNRLPVKNKNLFGNKIVIGGMKYDKGIAGHTGFSVVYNLSGKALSFSAVAGIDDEAHQSDPKDMKESYVNVIVLVDRKEVFRKTVGLNEKGIPVSIDLKGRHQIELRGEYGKAGFHKQRIAFANAVLEVEDKKCFLETAEEWRKKVEEEKQRRIAYPLAPDWRKIRIHKVKYKGWDDSYQISNGIIELVITPEFGGRIMSFKLKGGKNILTENGKYKKSNLKSYGYKFTNGGHFNRPQPQNYFIPCDPTLLFGKYSIEFPRDGEIILSSPKSWIFWLQFKFKIKLSRDKPEIEITSIHRNIAPFSNMAGIWSITRVKSKLATAVMMPEEMKNPPVKSSFVPETFYFQVNEDKGWLRLDLTDELWYRLGRSSIAWEEYPSVNQIKVLFPEMTFIKSFDYTPSSDKAFMGKFYPAHFYIHNLFIEVECHGPTKILASGSKIEFKEVWSIKKENLYERKL